MQVYELQVMSAYSAGLTVLMGLNDLCSGINLDYYDQETFAYIVCFILISIGIYFVHDFSSYRAGGATFADNVVSQ